MPEIYNCDPPRLLYRNNGVQSPDAYLDQYGVPDLSHPDIQTDVSESMFKPDGWFAAPAPEKRFLSGTIVEEVLKWYQDVYSNHGMTTSTHGALEPFTKPDGTPASTLTTGGHQFDGHTFHNPDWWKLVLRNRYVIDGEGPLSQSLINALNNTIDYYFTNRVSGYFSHGKMKSTVIRRFLWPYKLVDRVLWEGLQYISSGGTWASWSAFVNGGSSTRIFNSDTSPAMASYRLAPSGSGYSASAMFSFFNLATNETNRTVRQRWGLYGDGRNASIAIRFGASNGGTFKLGLTWLMSSTHPFSISNSSWVPNSQFFHTVVPNSVNVIEFPDSILDQSPPSSSHQPYLVLSPDLSSPPPTEGTTYSVSVSWSDIAFDNSVTGYPHNYPLYQKSPLSGNYPIGRLCTDAAFLRAI